MRQKSLYFVCHSGLEQACPVLDTGNPVFLTGFPLEFTPYLIRGGNDGLRNNVKKCWTHYISIKLTMILRIFDQYIPVRKIAFFFLESIFIGGMVILGTYLRFLGHPAGFYQYEYLSRKPY